MIMMKTRNAVAIAAGLLTGAVAQAQSPAKTDSTESKPAAPITVSAEVNFTNTYGIPRGFNPFPHASAQPNIVASMPVRGLTTGVGIWENIALVDGKTRGGQPFKAGEVQESDYFAFVGGKVGKTGVTLGYQQINITGLETLKEVQLTLEPDLPLHPKVFAVQDISAGSRRLGGEKQQYIEAGISKKIFDKNGVVMNAGAAAAYNRQYTVPTSGFAGGRVELSLEKELGPVKVNVNYRQFKKSSNHEFTTDYKQVGLTVKTK